MIRITCPICGLVIVVPAELAETIDNCSRCGCDNLVKLKISRTCENC